MGGIEFSNVTLACEDDDDNSDAIECAQEMVGMEFFDVTIATDDHNEDSVSVEPRQGIGVVNNVSTSTSYMEVNETPIEDYDQDVLSTPSSNSSSKFQAEAGS